MANLPNKSFVFNYNARDYDPATFTIPKTSGQTMDRDMVWTAMTESIRGQIEFNDDHLTIPTSAFSFFNFSTTGANPMNITTSTPNLTLIVKYKYGTNFGDVVANRSYSPGGYNWMLRSSSVISLHTSTSNTGLPSSVTVSDTSVTMTAAVVVNNKVVSIKNLTENTSNTPFTPSYQQGSLIFSFFAAFANQNEYPNEFRDGDFYWAYASREVLTDEEIQQVIKYNEGANFELSSTGSTVSRSAGSVSVGITSELNFSASTSANWISISPATGDSGTTSVTINYAENTGDKRTGIITFTNSDNDEITYTLVQKGVLFPIDNQYLNGNVINKEYQGSTVVNKAFLNGNVLVHRLIDSRQMQ